MQSSSNSDIIQTILSLKLAKQSTTSIYCLKQLIQTLTFPNPTKDQLSQLSTLLSNGKSLQECANTIDFQPDVNVNDILPVLSLDLSQDQESLDIAGFFVLRAVVTFLSHQFEHENYSQYILLFSLINFVMPSSYSKILQETFVYVLDQTAKNIKESYLAEVLAQINDFLAKIENVPIQLVNALVAILKSITNQVETFDLIIAEFLNLIARLLFQMQNDISDKSTYEFIFTTIQPFLNNLDPIAFSFFAKIISFFPLDKVRPFINSIPDTIIELMGKEQLSLSFSDNLNSLSKPLEIELASNQRFPFIAMETFKDNTVIDGYPSFSFEQQTLKDYFSPNTVLLLQSLSTMFEAPESSEMLSSLLQKIITDNANNEKLFELIIIALAICKDPELIKFVMKTKLFDPRINYFDYTNQSYSNNESYQVFFKARFLCFSVMPSISSIFEKIIEPFSRQPLILADLFHLLSIFANRLTPVSSKNEQFIKYFANLSSLYQTANIESNSNIKEIEFARSEMLRFTLNLLQNEDNSSTLFSIIPYTQMLFSYMYEKSLRPFVLNAFQVCCLKNSLDLSFCISDFFFNLLENTSDLHFKHDVVNMVNTLMTENSHYSQYFHKCISVLTLDLPHLQKDEFSKQYLLDLIQFVSTASENSQSIDSKAFLQAIQKTEGYEPSDAIYKALLSLIAGKTLAEITPTFEIKHPNILILFLLSFQKSKQFIPILKLLTELVSNSRINARACHIGHLDSLLLDIIQDSKSMEDNEIIASTMGLFVQIASVSSSNEIVLKFFKLFSPISENTVCPNQSFFFAILSHLISMEDYKPAAYLPISSNSPTISITGLYPKSLSTSFTVLLWIWSAQSNESTMKLFSISDNKSKGFDVFIKSNLLYIEVNDSKVFQLGSVPRSKWINCSVSIVYGEQDIQVITSIDTSFRKPISIEKIDFEKGQLSVQFGGVDQPSDFDNSALGPFGIFPFIKSNTILDIARNVQFQPDISNRLIFVNMKMMDESLFLDVGSMKGISAKINGNDFGLPLTFAQTLVEHCSLTALLPLLNQLDDTQQSSKMLSSIMLNLISLITSQPRSQIIFYETNGVRTLTCLLQHCNPKHLDFTLYQNLVTLYETATYEPLKNDIFEKLMINPEIWVLAPGQAQIQIYRHWSRTLFPQYWTIAKQYLSFQRLLNLLRIYYWYQPIEKGVAWLQRTDNMPVQDIRQNFLQILHSFSLKHFSTADFTELIGHCVSCKDPMQVCDLLSFLKLLVVSPESPIQNVKEVWSQFNSLHQLFNSNNESILIIVIDVFMSLHYLGLNDTIKVTHHVDILMDFIPRSMITSTFYLKILPLAKKYPDFMPLLFYTIIQLGGQSLPIVKENLQPSLEYARPKNWSLLPILAATKFGEIHDFQEFVMTFMASCSDDNWDKTYTMINLVEILFGIDANEEKASFLSDVCEKIINTQSLFKFDALHEFLDVAKAHLFFRQIEDNNPALMKEFMTSPFSSEIESEHHPFTKPKSINNITKKIFFDKLKEFDTERKRQYRFGLRIGQDGKWLDKKLGKNVIKLAMKTKSQTFHNVASLILIILYHEEPLEAKDQIYNLLKRNICDPPYADYLRRLIQDPKKKVTENCFETFIRDTEKRSDEILSFVNILAQKLQKFEEKCQNEKKEITNNSNHDLISTNKEQLHQEICIESHLRGLYNKSWNSLWSMMTFPDFPWYDSSINYHDKLTRDSTLSDFYCPTQWKLKDQLSTSRTLKELTAKSRSKRLTRHETTTLVRPKLDTKLIGIDTTIDDLKNIQARLIKLGGELYTQQPCTLTVEGSTILVNFDSHSKIFEASEITEISLKSILHKTSGIEIFSHNGHKSTVLNFTERDALSFLKTLSTRIEFQNVPIQTQSFSLYFKESHHTEKWLNGEYSNFMYLMLINKYSGRTFHSESLYPIMPWIIKDFDSDTLDSSKEDTFRDFAKPMKKGEPISNSGSVIHFLRVCEPFTTLYKTIYPTLKDANQEPQIKPSQPKIQPQAQETIEKEEQQEEAKIERQPSAEQENIEQEASIEQKETQNTPETQPERSTEPKDDTPTLKLPNVQSEEKSPKLPKAQLSKDFNLPTAFNIKRYKKFDSIKAAFSNNEGLELTPEFYYSPNFFEGIELPKWSKTPISFVYESRKMLESQYVTNHLNKWIDLVFGCKQNELGLDANYFKSVWDDQSDLSSIKRKQDIEFQQKKNGQAPPQLFKEPHPTRKFYTVEPLITTSHCFSGYSSHISQFVALQSYHNKNYHFICISEDNSIYTIRIDAEKQQISVKDTYSILPGHSFALYDSNIICADDNGSVKLVRDNYEVVVLHGQRTSRATEHGRCVAASNPVIVIGNSDSSLSLYHSNEFIKLIPTFTNKITCIDCLASFDLIVVGTSQNNIFFFTTKDGTPKCCIDTNGATPELLTITKKWGFVIMFGSLGHKKVIDVYTTNGQLIIRQEIPMSLTCWTTFSSRNDFDFVVAADNKGKIYVFEAFYANIGEPFYETHNEISNIIFSTETNVSFAFAKNGNIYMSPCNIP